LSHSNHGLPIKSGNVGSNLFKVKRFFSKYKFFHILVLPGVLYYIIFRYLPIFGLTIAFKDYRGFGGFQGIIDSPWVGFRNFSNLFASHYFWRLLSNTLIICTYRLIWGFPAPIILALLLNEVRNQRFKRTVQTITYLPHFISWVVAAGLVTMFLSPDTGAVNGLLKIFGVKPITFLADPTYFRSVLVATSIWKGVGGDP
jgi:putative aldouronate transport system permease protein